MLVNNSAINTILPALNQFSKSVSRTGDKVLLAYMVLQTSNNYNLIQLLKKRYCYFTIFKNLVLCEHCTHISKYELS